MDMMKMMKQAADLQKNMKKKQKELAKKNVEYTHNGVTIVASCSLKILSIKINSELIISNDIKKLEETILFTTQKVLDLAQESMKNEMGSLTSALSLPGNMKLPF